MPYSLLDYHLTLLRNSPTKLIRKAGQSEMHIVIFSVNSRDIAEIT